MNSDSDKDSSSDLKLLISTLKNKIKCKDISISKVKYPKLLLVSLMELDEMIGMNRLKDSISLQIMRLIQSINENKTCKSMLNTILYGPPGVGKTKVGIILAKIWYSLGYLEKNSMVSNASNVNISDNFNDSNTGRSSNVGIWLILLIIAGLYLYQGGKLIYNYVGLYWTLFIIAVIFFILVYCYYTINSSTNKRVINANNFNNININNIQLTSDNISNNDIITIVSRRDFVAEYVGQTAVKTKKLLQDNLGKVLFIDEAYSLLNDSRDPYGMEALTTLTLFMSMNPGSIIVIFAGYKDLLQNGIFKFQPGLPRRCLWHFECEGYDGSQLADIFIKQLTLEGWSLIDEYSVRSLIQNNINLFPSYGGDTERLRFFSQLESSRDYFFSSPTGEVCRKLSLDHIKKGLDRLKANNLYKDDSQQYNYNNNVNNNQNFMDTLKQMMSSNKTSNDRDLSSSD